MTDLPPFPPFDDGARMAFQHAREVAVRFGNDFIASDHVLLGILLCGPCRAIDALDELGVDRIALCARILEELEPGDDDARGELPFTPEMRDALLALAAELEARGLDAPDTGHLLWCLAAPRRGPAAAALRDCGVAPETLHDLAFRH